jgi:putative zincin peptidase
LYFNQGIVCRIIISTTVQPASKVAEIRVNKIAVNVLGTLLTLVLCVTGDWGAHSLPRYAPPAPWHMGALLVSIIVLMPVHEGLHALGLVGFAGISWSHIRFGMMWRALMPYCHCTVPISLRGYRLMGLLPLMVTGLLSIGCLLFYPTDWLGLFTGVAVGSCIGDVWLLVRLRRFSGALLVQDSPTEIGCDVYAQ